MKGRQTIIGLWGLTVLLASCSKDPDLRPQYVSGQLIISFYDSVRFESAFTLLDTNDLEIKELSCFSYYIKTTQDSVYIIDDILQTLPYLLRMEEGYNYYVSRYENDTLKLQFTFKRLDIQDKEDWMALTVQLKLKEELINISFFKWGVIGVPEGQEEYWADRLEQYDIIKNASLNHYFYLDD